MCKGKPPLAMASAPGGGSLMLSAGQHRPACSAPATAFGRLHGPTSPSKLVRRIILPYRTGTEPPVGSTIFS